MGRFEDKLLDWAGSNQLFKGLDRILLAVSGGADSVAMTVVLCRLRQQGLLSCDFVIGHVNHGLRGAESDADEAFVKEVGQSLQISVLSQAIDVQTYAAQHKLSIETAGRTLRLKTLAAMACQNGCDVIATAHHRDDQAETLVHRLIRGTGFRGLCGIWPVSEVYGAKFIRPMLGIRRTEIIRYCTENGLLWREDTSNRVVDFTRNRIRHQILPELENNSDAIVERLSVLSIESRRFLRRVEEQAQLILEKGRFDRANNRFVIEQGLLRDCQPWVFYEVIRQVMVSLNIGLRDYKEKHFDAIRRLIEQKRVKTGFPGGVEIIAEKRNIFVQLKSSPRIPPQKPIILKIGQTVQFGQWRISSRLLNKSEVNLEEFRKTKDSFVEWFEADKITGHLEIRLRQKGDQFWPIGAKSQKKVARFLIDSGLEANIKESVFIVKDAEKILWLAPIRMSQHAKVTGKTQKILEIQLFKV
jgi:tRNA(Ile)-lysidine synthase